MNQDVASRRTHKYAITNRGALRVLLVILPTSNIEENVAHVRIVYTERLHACMPFRVYMKSFVFPDPLEMSSRCLGSGH